MTLTKKVFLVLTIICTAGLALLTFTGFLGRFAYLLELTSHFRLQYAIGSLPLLLSFLFLKNKPGIIVVSILLLTNFFQVINLGTSSLFHKKQKDSYQTEWTILQMNVYTANQSHDKVIQYIKETNPDIIALEEINSRWLENLSDALKGYSFQKYEIREDNFGIGLFSRVPPETMEIKYFEESGIPSILAEFNAGDEPVTLILTHPLPPASPSYFKRRNNQLKQIEAVRSTYNQKVIVIGDLNSTPWSYYFKRFKKDMNLKDTRKGFQIHNTWPTTFPLMLIPLDHCLISGGIATLKREIGPNIGSDHYPVLVQLGI